MGRSVVHGVRPRGNSSQTPSAPTWTNITARTWVEIPGDTLSDADPDSDRNAAYTSVSGQTAVVTAWNGAAMNSSSAVLWLPGLGGHSDYYGNEVYKWNLNAESPTWTRVIDPSDLGSYTVGSGTASTYSDGRPRSTHSYNACVYIPGYGPAQAGLCARSPDGDIGTRAPYYFNESTGAATFGTASNASGASTSIAACFDSTRGTAGSVWRRWQGTSVMQRWNVASDSWTDGSTSNVWSGFCSLAAHPSGDYLLVGNGDDDGGVTHQTVSGGWCVYKCADDTYPTPTFSGTVSGGLWPGMCQPVWVPDLGAFCAWDNATDRTRITTLTPGTDPFTDTWTISYLTVDGSNAVTPSAAATNGTYGRFAYSSLLGGFVLFNSATGPGYFFKL